MYITHGVWLGNILPLSFYKFISQFCFHNILKTLPFPCDDEKRKHKRNRENSGRETKRERKRLGGGKGVRAERFEWYMPSTARTWYGRNIGQEEKPKMV